MKCRWGSEPRPTQETAIGSETASSSHLRRALRGALEAAESGLDRVHGWEPAGQETGGIGRARLLALFLVIQALQIVFLAPLYLFVLDVPVLVFVSAGSACALVGSAWLLRRGRLKPATLLTMGYAAVAMVGVGVFEGAFEMSISPWWAALPLLGGYLAGWRVAGFLGGLSATFMAFLVFLHRAGLGIPLDPFGDDPLAMLAGHGGGTVLIWVFALLFERSRSGMLRELRQANADLQDREARLHALFDHTINLVCSVDTELRLTAVNRPMRERWREFFDARIEPGTALLDNLPPAACDRDAWQATLHHGLRGESLRTTQVLDTLQGRRHLSVSVNPIIVRGEVIGASLYAQDVTDRIEADERLVKARRRLIDLSRQAGMAQMATGLLHDVGNVLNSITVTTSTVQDRLQGLHIDALRRLASHMGAEDGPDPQEVKNYLEALARHLAAQRGRLLEQTEVLERDVARVRTIVATQDRYTHQAGVVEQIDLEELLDAAVEPYRLVLAEQDLDLVVEAEPLERLEVDRGRVLQVLSALLDNARHAVLTARGEDPRVVVRGRGISESRFAIDVIDNGVGVATDDLPHLFEHGYSTKQDAHGYGLHASANAAREMKGTLSAHSQGRGEGARFTLELPRRAERALHASRTG